MIILFFSSAVQAYRLDIVHLKQALAECNERNHQIESDITRAFEQELKSKTDRLQVKI